MILQILDRLIDGVLGLYSFVLVLRCIFDWVQYLGNWRPQGGMASFVDLVYSLTEPPLRAIRKVIPPIRIGNAFLDVGFIVLWVAIGFLQWLL
ncbi:MAG: YggT family protein [Bifidobacteriaceae bacterium]|nr:YggT family protein [Bifidobacteriaceae bacterium]